MGKVPVTILAGFLGAGKTTLLNHVLAAAQGVRLAVLVNDFGAINIDAELITRVDGETISLANGCVCCTIRDDLATAIADLLEGPEPPQHILTETSGVSEPAAVAMGIAMSSRLALRAAVDAVVTVVDAEQVMALNGEAGALAVDQIAAADIVVVNKIDLVAGDGLNRVRDWIRAIAPSVRIVEASHGAVPAAIVLGTRVRPPRVAAAGGHRDHHHESTYATWSWSEDEPLALQSLYATLGTLPLGVYRAKGIVYLREVPERRVIVQVVGARVSIARGAAWGEDPRRSRLVVIGAAGAFDAAVLERRFRACRASLAQVASTPMTEAVVRVLRRG
ncbi:MAG: GTP-binding protein [Gammaproteobacteria bacterium]|nr:GTP-binding protein [Gammaproteobacteria bacterium]